MVRKMLAQMLRRLGCVVDEARDGQVAIDIIPDKLSGNEEVEAVKVEEQKKEKDKEGAAAMPYDVILMDSVMPRVTGPEATEVIVQQLGFTNLLVGVTGNILPTDVTGTRHGS
jgi:CheY-like chemotaxis protein